MGIQFKGIGRHGLQHVVDDLHRRRPRAHAGTKENLQKHEPGYRRQGSRDAVASRCDQVLDRKRHDVTIQAGGGLLPSPSNSTGC